MSTLTIPYTFSSGATIRASEHNVNFDTIYSDFNGNIGNVNFSASAAIVDTKLATITTSSKIDFSALSTTNQATGDILFYSGTNLWTRIARGTANQSLKCQHDSQTVLLLHFDGTDGSTAFTDSSLSIKTVTANGNIQIDTDQSVFGGASGLFDGTGDYLSLSDSADWEFGTGDFTIDARVRWNVLPSDTYTLFAQQTDSQNAYQFSFYVSGGSYYWSFIQDVSNVRNISVVCQQTAPSANTWYHVALVRTGNDFKIFINGTQIGITVTDTDSIADFNQTPTLGCARIDSPSNFLNGWIDEFRISKGIARWTTNFTPEISAYLPDLIWIT